MQRGKKAHHGNAAKTKRRRRAGREQGSGPEQHFVNRARRTRIEHLPDLILQDIKPQRHAWYIRMHQQIDWPRRLIIRRSGIEYEAIIFCAYE
jgi:hypothetical protein